MAGLWRSALGVVVFLCVASWASALGNCGWYAPMTYYYPAPAYYYFAPRVMPVPDASPSTPQTKEPSMLKLDKTATDRAPMIITTRALAAGSAKTGPANLKVGFWNLTGRDITLTVGGKAHSLAKNRAVTLDLEREFSWQIDRLPAHIERVPDGLSAHEVVIRD